MNVIPFLDDLNRSGCRIRLAIICGIHKLGLLLYYWGASWIFDGLGLQTRSYGMFVAIFLSTFYTFMQFIYPEYVNSHALTYVSYTIW